MLMMKECNFATHQNKTVFFWTCLLTRQTLDGPKSCYADCADLFVKCVELTENYKHFSFSIF